jgi:hypothetical protein
MPTPKHRFLPALGVLLAILASLSLLRVAGPSWRAGAWAGVLETQDPEVASLTELERMVAWKAGQRVNTRGSIEVQVLDADDVPCAAAVYLFERREHAELSLFTAWDHPNYPDLDPRLPTLVAREAFAPDVEAPTIQDWAKVGSTGECNLGLRRGKDTDVGRRVLLVAHSGSSVGLTWLRSDSPRAIVRLRRDW